MKIDTLVLGDYQTNCYVLRESEDDKECVVIDPGFSAHVLIEFLEANELKPEKIWLTHGHSDHIAGIPLLKENYDDLPVWAPQNDADMVVDDRLNLAFFTGVSLNLEPPEKLFDVGDTLAFATLQFDVLETPGHTPGGVSLHGQKESVVFSGDALFAGSIGRTDFPGGDHDLLIRMIREYLFSLPEDTVVYPGHGPSTTIGREKSTNSFFQ
jgi:glyoxylase-like metal-dependent hydrolase (beta-lactamase superfamily II)